MENVEHALSYRCLDQRPLEEVNGAGAQRMNCARHITAGGGHENEDIWRQTTQAFEEIDGAVGMRQGGIDQGASRMILLDAGEQRRRAFEYLDLS